MNVRKETNKTISDYTEIGLSLSVQIKNSSNKTVFGVNKYWLIVVERGLINNHLKVITTLND